MVIIEKEIDDVISCSEKDYEKFKKKYPKANVKYDKKNGEIISYNSKDTRNIEDFLNKNPLKEELDYSNLQSFKNSILEIISEDVNLDLVDKNLLKISAFSEKQRGDLLKNEIQYIADFDIFGKGVEINCSIEIKTTWKKRTETSKTLTYYGKINGKKFSGTDTF